MSDAVPALNSSTSRATESSAFTGALAALPLALLAINNSWVFGRIGYTDPWIYSGYHLHPEVLFRNLPDVYYGTRMPWIALGWAVHRLWAPEVAQYVLRLALFYVATFSLFWTIDLIFRNKAAAFAAACLLGANSWFLWAIGWDYVDGPSIACLLLSFAGIAGTALGSRWRAAAILWGVATALTLNVFIMLVVFLPLEILAFVLLSRNGPRRVSLSAAGLFGLGFLAANIAMALMSVGLGGRILFFLPQIAAAWQVSENRELWYAPWGEWLGSASWLILPAIALTAGVVVTAIYRRRIFAGPEELRSGSGSAFPAQVFAATLICAVAALGFAVMEAAHYYVLEIWYRANSLWPVVFIALGACIAAASADWPPASRFFLAVATPVVCLAPWTLGAMGIRLPLPIGEPASGLSPGAAMVVHPGPILFSGAIVEALWIAGGAGLLAAAVWIGRPLALVAAIAYLAFLNVATISPYSQIRIPVFADYRSRALAVFDISRVVDDFASGPIDQFWFDTADDESYLFTSAAAMYLQGKALPIVPGRRIVLLSTVGDPVEKVKGALAEQHLAVTPLTRQHIQRGTIGFDVVVAEVSPSASK